MNNHPTHPPPPARTENPGEFTAFVCMTPSMDQREDKVDQGH